MQCLQEPCCPQWSCQTCPQTRPDFQTECSRVQEGLECDYGSQECCGEEYPQVKMQCASQQWQGYYVDTICMFGSEKSNTRNIIRTLL